MPSLADSLKATLKTALGHTDAQHSKLSINDLKRLRNKTVLAKTDAELAKLSITDQKKLGGV